MLPGVPFPGKGMQTSANWEKKMPVSSELLEILVCPKCKGDLYLTAKQDGLVCENCSLKYEIRDDIPIMLIDEAQPFPSTDKG